MPAGLIESSPFLLSFRQFLAGCDVTMCVMESHEFSLTGARRGAWLLFWASLANLALMLVTDGVSWAGPVFVTLPLIAIAYLRKGPAKLLVAEDRIEQSRRQLKPQVIPWDAVERFVVSRKFGRACGEFVPSVANIVRTQGRKPSNWRQARFQARKRAAGVDFILWDTYRGMSNKRLAEVLNQRLEQHRRQRQLGFMKAQLDSYTALGRLSERIAEQVVEAARDERGIRYEDALAAAGSLLGFSASAGSVAALSAAPVVDIGINIVETADGSAWLFGDRINDLLIENPVSALNLVGWHVRTLGGTPPDLLPIVRRMAATVGSADYGQLDLGTAPLPSQDFRAWVQQLWPDIGPALEGSIPLAQLWPRTLYRSVVTILDMSRDRIDPTLAGRIVAEYALAACHLDPRPFSGQKAA